MNVAKYQILDNNNKITIAVNILTTDAALVTADVDLYLNDKKYIKAESKNGEHFIAKSLLGISKELSTGLLVIEADIDLKLVDIDVWEECFNNLKIEYILEGGKEKKTYNLEKDDIKYKSSGRIIKTKKFVYLKQVNA